MTRITLLICSLALVACEGDASHEKPRPKPVPEAEPPAETDLRWKRARAVERDLMRALEIDAGTLCREFGTYRCLRYDNALNAAEWYAPSLGPGLDAFFDLETPGGLHLVPLGGHDPYFATQYTGIDQPIITTPLALDRVVLSACAARASLDAAGPAIVFSAVDFQGVVTPEAANAVATQLYRRLHARDAEATESEIIREMASDDSMGPQAFATLSCFAVATTAEFIFH